MKPLYSQVEFNNATSREQLSLECLHCHNTFFATKNRIQSILKGKSVWTGDFCSTKCQNDLQSPPVIVNCDQCGKPFRKHPKEVKKVKHNFCCQSCAAKYNNAHKTKGTRVSKLERWLAEQLVLLYPTLEFHFNRTDAINGELDIYIPALKLAFELNGIFHYEPIYGVEKLTAMQTNDHRKMLACAEHGIELCVLDVSHEKYFKPAKAQKFLDITANLIHSKLSGT
jgi:ribosomal protein L44E